MLQGLASTLKETVREADLCARYGGEEFVVVLPATSADGAMELAERIRLAVEASEVEADGKTLKITVSAGVNSYRKDGLSKPEWMVKEADMALYEAKRSGRNAVRQFEAAPASPWSIAS